MISIRRLLGVLLAVLLTATVLSLSSGAHAAQVRSDARRRQGRPRARLPEDAAQVRQAAKVIPQKPVKCNLNGFKQGRPTIVLWGDSHAWQMIPALRNAARGRDVNLVAFLMGSCPAMDPALTQEQRQNGAPACLLSNDRALQYVTNLKAHKKRVHVLLGTYWQRYLHAIRIGDSTSYHGEMAAYWKKRGPAALPHPRQAAGQRGRRRPDAERARQARRTATSTSGTTPTPATWPGSGRCATKRPPRPG